MAQQAWMPVPQAPAGCPKGLEYLTEVDTFIVKQDIELLEAITGFETQNKYKVLNTQGQQIYRVLESSSCLQRQCCSNNRAVELRVLDNDQNQIMAFKRPLHCCTCAPCFACKQDVMTVEAPPGNVIGYSSGNSFCLKPTFTIYSPEQQPVLNVTAPLCGCGCSCSPKFTVMSNDGAEIGFVQKKWSGGAKEIFTDADNFTINFPMDLEVKAKASLLATLFLIDYEYFESGGHGQGAGGVAAASAGEGCLCLLLNGLCFC